MNPDALAQLRDVISVLREYTGVVYRVELLLRVLTWGMGLLVGSMILKNLVCVAREIQEMWIVNHPRWKKI